MAIQDDLSIAANGDVRHDSGTTNYSVLELHRYLSAYADDAVASGDDLLDITDSTPSDRSTDNIIELLSPYNIDDTLATFLYDGSIIQAGGDTIYDGIVVFSPQGTYMDVVQNGAVITNHWTTGKNADSNQGISHRFLVKVRDTASDTDGRRLLGQTREFGYTYSEFPVNGTARGNNVIALTSALDLNNETVSGTVATWTGISNTEGYRSLDVNGDSTPEPYYSEWDRDVYSINQFYERMKYLTRRDTAETLYGLNGELFRGITHEINIDNPSGTFVEPEGVSWGSGVTAGTGQLLAIDSTTAGTKMWIQLLTGVAPTDGLTITGVSTATADVNVTVQTRPLSLPFCGASTGSAIIGSYGFGIEPNDLTSNDKLTDLGTNLRTPPNNVTFTVFGLIADEDYCLVGPESAGIINEAQLSASGAYTGGEATFTVQEAIPLDTPTSGTIRCWNGDTFSRVTYTGWGNTSDFTGCSSVPAMSDGDDVFISYVDELADSAAIAATAITTDVEYIIVTTGTTNFTLIGAADSDPGTIFTATGAGTGTGTAKPRVTTADFTGVYQTDRSLFIRVRDGKSSPIKTFETTGTLGSGGGSTTAIRTTDA